MLNEMDNPLRPSSSHECFGLLPEWNRKSDTKLLRQIIVSSTGSKLTLSAEKQLQQLEAENVLMTLSQAENCGKLKLQAAITLAEKLGVSKLAIGLARKRLNQMARQINLDEQWMLNLGK
jgi:hypothetical protein